MTNWSFYEIETFRCKEIEDRIGIARKVNQTSQDLREELQDDPCFHDAVRAIENYSN